MALTQRGWRQGVVDVLLLTRVAVDAGEKDGAPTKLVHDQVNEGVVAHELLGLERTGRAEGEKCSCSCSHRTLLVELQACLVHRAVQPEARRVAVVLTEPGEVSHRGEDLAHTHLL